MISQDGILYILLMILGVSIANLYGLKRIFILEKKIMSLEAVITKSLLGKKRKR